MGWFVRWLTLCADPLQTLSRLQTADFLTNIVFPLPLLTANPEQANLSDIQAS